MFACENKVTDRCAVTCFLYMDSTIPLLLKSKVSDLVRNTEDRFFTCHVSINVKSMLFSNTPCLQKPMVKCSDILSDISLGGLARHFDPILIKL